MSIKSVLSSVFGFAKKVLVEFVTKNKFEVVLSIHIVTWAIPAILIFGISKIGGPVLFVFSLVFVALLEGIATIVSPKFWANFVPAALTALFVIVLTLVTLRYPASTNLFMIMIWIDAFLACLIKSFLAFAFGL